VENLLRASQSKKISSTPVEARIVKLKEDVK
jgi:hypothetical protein